MHKTDDISWTERIISATGYLGVLCLVPLMLARGNHFMLYHGRQGLMLFVVWFIWWAVGWIIILIPVVGAVVMWIGYAALGVGALFGIIQALRGKEWDLPVLGAYARKVVF